MNGFDWTVFNINHLFEANNAEWFILVNFMLQITSFYSFQLIVRKWHPRFDLAQNKYKKPDLLKLKMRVGQYQDLGSIRVLHLNTSHRPSVSWELLNLTPFCSSLKEKNVCFSQLLYLDCGVFQLHTLLITVKNYVWSAMHKYEY